MFLDHVGPYKNWILGVILSETQNLYIGLVPDVRLKQSNICLWKKCKIRGLQHWVFPGGHPSKY